MSEGKKPAGRRRFLFGLLTGAGAVAALSSASPAKDKTEPTAEATEPQPILYHRTEETERYYRSLYR
jgi:hypothetical protein